MKHAAAARKRRRSTRKVTARASALPRLLGLLCLLGLLGAEGAALAVDPAGGPPYPPGTAPPELVALGPEAPDASLDERGWLAPASTGELPLAASPSPGSSALTLLALLLVAGLGGAALWLQRRKKAASPAAQLIESRLTLLSSTRVGPKAFAVSAEVNGRVLLLGVTDHTVTHLGWLDPPELEATATAEQGLPEAAESAEVPAADGDDLPDDYPGSALRAAAAAQQASLLPPASPLTSSQNLRRFQEVLRGAVPAAPNPLRAPSAPAPRHELGRPSLPLGSDAASTLAALTSDVVPSATLAGTVSAAPSEAAPTGRSVAPASLRRKRQRRQEQLSKPTKAVKSATPEPPAAELEGQVAGLRALKNG